MPHSLGIIDEPLRKAIMAAPEAEREQLAMAVEKAIRLYTEAMNAPLERYMSPSLVALIKLLQEATREIKTVDIGK